MPQCHKDYVHLARHSRPLQRTSYHGIPCRCCSAARTSYRGTLFCCVAALQRGLRTSNFYDIFRNKVPKADAKRCYEVRRQLRCRGTKSAAATVHVVSKQLQKSWGFCIWFRNEIPFATAALHDDENMDESPVFARHEMPRCYLLPLNSGALFRGQHLHSMLDGTLFYQLRELPQRPWSEVAKQVRAVLSKKKIYQSGFRFKGYAFFLHR
jgi:hypothetical protein